MGKLILYVILSIVGGSLIFSIHGDNTWKDFGVHILAVGLIFCLESSIENWKYIWLFCVTNTFYRNKKIRLSISYLYQIKVDGKYLLVKGNRIKNQYQPVGGVFKRFRESYYQLKDLDVLDDDNIPIDSKSIDDLRIKLPGKNVNKFLKWFDSQLGREVSPYREFHEELIQTNILLQKDFPYPNYLHPERIQTPIHFSKHFQCYEILIAEIFKLMPDEKQLSILTELTQKESDYYVWADEETVKRLGANIGLNISETASWVL